MKQASFSYIATQLLSKTEKQNLGQIFKEMDTNGDGRLSLDEVKNGYEKFFGQAKSEEDIEIMFKKVDTDNSGYIDYTEFVVASIDESQLLNKEKLQAAFRMFDKDGSGSISTDEIKQVLGYGKTLNEEQAESILREVDENGDNEISFEEFSRMMKRLA